MTLNYIHINIIYKKEGGKIKLKKLIFGEIKYKILGFNCISQITILSGIEKLLRIEEIFKIKTIDICTLILIKTTILLLFFLLIDNKKTFKGA
ncbi:MAG: hypothetical protein KAS01_03290 [Candidatus Pacebacteria bacterium]|nr:hypothetical protein [Candidatus Paceibacterota bacterium]